LKTNAKIERKITLQQSFALVYVSSIQKVLTKSKIYARRHMLGGKILGVEQVKINSGTVKSVFWLKLGFFAKKFGENAQKIKKSLPLYEKFRKFPVDINTSKIQIFFRPLERVVKTRVSCIFYWLLELKHVENEKNYTRCGHRYMRIRVCHLICHKSVRCCVSHCDRSKEYGNL